MKKHLADLEVQTMRRDQRNERVSEAARNKELIRRYVEELWNKGNLDILDELVPSDYSLGFSESPEEIGPKVLKKPAMEILAGLPDHQMTIEDIIAEDDRVAWRWTAEGTHLGILLGATPTGRKVKMQGIAIYQIFEGKIVERHGETDALGLLEQLGISHGTMLNHDV